jgi:hypothetical protein
MGGVTKTGIDTCAGQEVRSAPSALWQMRLERTSSGSCTVSPSLSAEALFNCALGSGEPASSARVSASVVSAAVAVPFPKFEAIVIEIDGNLKLKLSAWLCRNTPGVQRSTISLLAFRSPLKSRIPFLLFDLKELRTIRRC